MRGFRISLHICNTEQKKKNKRGLGNSKRRRRRKKRKKRKRKRDSLIVCWQLCFKTIPSFGVLTIAHGFPWMARQAGSHSKDRPLTESAVSGFKLLPDITQQHRNESHQNVIKAFTGKIPWNLLHFVPRAQGIRSSRIFRAGGTYTSSNLSTEKAEDEESWTQWQPVPLLV